MRVIGEATEGMFLLDCGEGWGRLLHLRDGDAVLFDEHRLDDDLIATVTPCTDRAAAIERLATLVLRHGEADSACPRTRVLDREQVRELAETCPTGLLADAGTAGPASARDESEAAA